MIDEDDEYEALETGRKLAQSSARVASAPQIIEETSPLKIAIEKAQSDILGMIEKGGASAKEMAAVTREAATLVLVETLRSDNERLRLDAADRLLERSDGKAGADITPQVNVNIFNAQTDDDKEKMARALIFANLAAQKRGVKDFGVIQDEPVFSEDIIEGEIV